MIFRYMYGAKSAPSFTTRSVQSVTTFTAPMFELEKKTKLLEKTFSLWSKNAKKQITYQEDIKFFAVHEN